MNIQRFIDHTHLNPLSSQDNYKQLCNEAIKYNFKAICVPPCWVSSCKALIKNYSDIEIASVVGFPNGYATTASKIAEAKDLVKLGASEIDFVANLSFIKSNQFNNIEKEISLLRKSLPDTTLKIIIESGALTENEIVNVSKISLNSNIDFIKTSTGFYKVGARIEDVELISKTTQGKCGIKASGGIKDYETAKKFLQAGATRLGCSSGAQIVLQQTKEEKNHL